MRVAWLLPIFLLSDLIGAQDSRNVRVLDYKFRDAAQWPLRSGRVLNVEYEQRQVTRIQLTGMTLYEITYPDVIHQIIASDEHRTLLFLVMREKKPGSLYYAYLLTARENEKGDVEFHKSLFTEVPPMRKHQSVMELGAISEDARVALIKMGEPDRDEAPYTVGKVWETWDLVAPKLLGTGLKLDPVFAR